MHKLKLKTLPLWIKYYLNILFICFYVQYIYVNVIIYKLYNNIYLLFIMKTNILDYCITMQHI